MEELSERCVLLKGLPPDYTDGLVRECFELAHKAFREKTVAFHCHQDGDNERRWIVLFTRSEDAKQCILSGPWQANYGGGSMTVTPDYCAECIIPDEWAHQKTNSANRGSSTDEWIFPDKEVFTDSLSTRGSILVPDSLSMRGSVLVPDSLVPQPHTFQHSDSMGSSDTSMKSDGFEFVTCSSDLLDSSKPPMAERNSDTTGVKYKDQPSTLLKRSWRGKASNKDVQQSSSVSSDESTFSSSELFGSGKTVNKDNRVISPTVLLDKLSDCSMESMDMFGSGRQIPQKDNGSVRSDKNDSVLSADMFGSGPRKEKAQAPDVHSDTHPNLKQKETPLSHGYVEMGMVPKTQPSDRTHAVSDTGNIYTPMGWPQPVPYYPYPPQYPPQAGHPPPPQAYYPATPYPQYPVPAPGVQPGYYPPYPVPHYPPQGYPVSPDTYLQPYSSWSGGSTQPHNDGASAGRADRPPMPIPREYKPQPTDQAMPLPHQYMPTSPQSTDPPAHDTSTPTSVGNPPKINTTHTDPAEVTTGLPTSTAIPSDVVSPLADASSLADPLADARPLVDASRPDRNRADASLVKDETKYVKIKDIDVNSQIRFPGAGSPPSSWKPQLPARPMTEALRQKKPSEDSADSLHHRRTEPVMHRKADIVVKSDDSIVAHIKPVIEGQLGKKTDTDEEEPTKTCKIKVHGIGERTSRETLELFFESKRSSGGDEIMRMEFSAVTREAIIEFQSPAVVERVINIQEKSPLLLDSCELTVRAYITPPIDKYKLFVSGIAEMTTQESLENYLEARCGVLASNVMYGDTPGTALVTFTSMPDIDKVRTECKRRPLENNVLSVSPVSVSRCVKVTGFGMDTTEESILYYFENGRRSGGGSVETTDMDAGDCVCMVYFANAEDANRVCESTRQHTLNNSQLSVRLHYKCLEPDPALILKIPPPIRFDELNSYFVRFIQNCKPLRKNLEDVMASSYAKIIWPPTKEDCLEIICTLEQGNKDGRRIVQDWEQKCRDNLGACTEKLVTHDQLHAAQEVWSCMKDRLREIAVEDPESVALFVNQDDHGIIIVGKQDAANRLSKQVLSIISDLEQKLADEKQNITKVKTVKVYQLALLNVCRFVDDLTKKGFVAKIDQEKREISFTGMKKDVDDAMAKVPKFLNSFEQSTISLPKLAKDMLFARQTRDYIRGQMKKARVIGVWDVVRGEDLVIMYSRNVKDLDTAINIVKRCLKYKAIPLDMNMEELLRGDSGKAHIDNMCSKYDCLIKVQINTGELFFVTVDYLFNEVTDECMKFFDLNALISEFIHVDNGKLRFLYSHYKRDLRQIEEQYSRLAVRIMEVDKRTRHGFKIEGKKDGCKLAISRLQTFVDKVLCQDYTVKSPSAKEFFSSEEGKSELQNIEMAQKCVLLVDSPAIRHRSSSSVDSMPQERAACVIKGCKLVVMEGDLTEMKVDAIVNPSTRMLQHKLGLAGAIIDKGGYNIQKECEAYVTKKGPLADAELFVSGSGLLPCQHIIHAVIPTWRDGTRNEDRLLKMAVKQCIEEAERCHCKTIAFPAVGARQFRFPLEKVTQVVIETVLTHLQLGTSESILTGVFFCDLRTATVNHFISTMKAKLGHRNVQEMAPIGQASHAGNDSSTDSSGGSYEEAFGSHHGGDRDGNSGGFHSGDSGIRVTVVKGELAQQNIDVLINSTNHRLDLRIGAISKSLLAVGGQALLRDCTTKYPDGIRVGQVATSTGGNLQCKQVYHGMLDKWDGGQGHSEKVMSMFVERCLALADEQKLTSLAFPALGTGVLGFPADIVAKLMFTVIHAYSDGHPNTGIRNVLLVVYPGDTATVKAFEMIEKVQFRQPSSKWSTSPVAGRRRPNSASQDMVRPASTGRGHTFNIGQLSVEITQGDITKETTGAIVNSTLVDLDLQKGAVSKAILMAAGQSIQTECWTPENRALMLRNEFVITGSGRLLCQKIIHMKAKAHPAGWQKNVIRCLQEAEFLGLNSISFPALGTGGKGCSPDSVAHAMFVAFRQFVNSKEYRHCLKKIKIVIFQADMVEKFAAAATEAPAKRGWNLFKNKSETPQEDKKLSIFIYTDSQYKVDVIRRELDGMFVEDQIYKAKSFLEELADRQIKKIQGMCRDCGVHIQMGGRSISLEGYSRNVSQAKVKVTAYLNNIEKDATKVAAVALPTNWTKMSLKDATQVILLPLTSADYVKVSQKFLAETRLGPASIISIERIQNPTLYTQYIGKKSYMEHMNPGRPVERQLWHGTAGSTINTINQAGFNRNYNQGSSHGVGVYFAVTAATSLGYCQADATGSKHMYLANVLTGDFCQGQAGIRHPPAKNAANANVTYDSTTDNVNAPNFFVIFHDAQAYPCFHVTFK